MRRQEKAQFLHLINLIINVAAVPKRTILRT
jgi:hypothetical protein